MSRQGVGVARPVGHAVLPGLASVVTAYKGARLDRHVEAPGGGGVGQDPAYVADLRSGREAPY